jgi:hypothetical protein
MVRPLNDQLRGCAAVDCKVHLVLHPREELLGDRRVLVVIHGGGIDVGDFLVKSPLRKADLADFLQQALEIILAEERAVFHALAVHHVTAQRVVPQHSGGPLAEGSGALRVHPVADGNDGIEVVVLDLALHLPLALGLNH